MCQHILLLFMATYSDNQLLIELFLSFLPRGLYRIKLPDLEEGLRNHFTDYFPDGVIFSAVLARDHSCINKEVKFKMRTPFTILKRIIFEKVLKLIEQYACLIQANDVSEATENIDPIRYKTLLNNLTQEEELALISVQEFQGFLHAIMHEDALGENVHEGNLINYEICLREREQLIRMQDRFRNGNLHKDELDGVLNGDGNTINSNNEQVQHKEEDLMHVSEIQRILNIELHEDTLDEMLNEVEIAINYDVINYEERSSIIDEARALFLSESGDDSRGTFSR